MIAPRSETISRHALHFLRDQPLRQLEEREPLVEWFQQRVQHLDQIVLRRPRDLPLEDDFVVRTPLPFLIDG
jgi:hypothetical protein